MERHTVAKIIKKCRAAIPDGRTLPLTLNPNPYVLSLLSVKYPVHSQQALCERFAAVKL